MKSTTTTVNLNEVVFEAVIKAKEQANLAQQDYYNQKMSGREWGCCGFAWAVAQVKGNTKMGKALLAAGFTKIMVVVCKCGCQVASVLKTLTVTMQVRKNSLRY